MNDIANWQKNFDYFKWYDFFQKNRSSYIETLNLHAKILDSCKLILDSGCGTGNLSEVLIKKNHKITAVDINKKALQNTQKKLKSINPNDFNTILLDLSSSSFSKTLEKENFDGASSMLVLPFVDDIRSYFCSVYNSLKENGKFIISSWSCVEDIHYGVIDIMENELYDKEILPKYLKEWRFHNRPSKEFEKEILKKRVTEKDLISFLKEANFKKIEIISSPYGKYVYSILAEK